jgi:hypothetical protein
MFKPNSLAHSPETGLVPGTTTARSGISAPFSRIAGWSFTHQTQMFIWAY